MNGKIKAKEGWKCKREKGEMDKKEGIKSERKEVMNGRQKRKKR